MDVDTETQDLVPDIIRFIVHTRRELIFKNKRHGKSRTKFRDRCWSEAGFQKDTCMVTMELCNKIHSGTCMVTVTLCNTNTTERLRGSAVQEPLPPSEGDAKVTPLHLAATSCIQLQKGVKNQKNILN